MQIVSASREVTIKIVYYGPSLSGKTTNLISIYRSLTPQCRGRFMTVNTKNDRTLFFDLLPIHLTTSSGYHFKVKLFTVPGQVIHNSTRRLVLSGADGVVFVADSQIRESRANSESLANLKKNLVANGLSYDQISVVLQFNKRDLPSIRTDEELDRLRQHCREPLYRSVAIHGEGVRETLFGILAMTYYSLNKQHSLDRKFNLNQREFMEKLLLQFDLPHSFLNRIKA